jgi:hypothetical protein
MVVNDRKDVLDFIGESIEEGQTIAYPGRKGSEMWLSHGIVKTVHENGTLDVETSSGKVVRLLRSDRVAVLGVHA